LKKGSYTVWHLSETRSRTAFFSFSPRGTHFFRRCRADSTVAIPFPCSSASYPHRPLSSPFLANVMFVCGKMVFSIGVPWCPSPFLKRLLFFFVVAKPTSLGYSPCLGNGPNLSTLFSVCPPPLPNSMLKWPVYFTQG